MMMHQLLSRMEKLLYNGPNMGKGGRACVLFLEQPAKVHAVLSSKEVLSNWSTPPPKKKQKRIIHPSSARAKVKSLVSLSLSLSLCTGIYIYILLLSNLTFIIPITSSCLNQKLTTKKLYIKIGLLGKAGLKQRKEFEKSVVEWVDETMVPLCPGCGGGFGLFRRRHHCRLCGGVLCGPCSLGLSGTQCVELSEPINTEQGSGGGGGAVKKRRKPTLGDEMLRVCHDCHRTLIVAFNIKAEQAKLRSKKKPSHPSLRLHKVISTAIRSLLPPVNDEIIDEDDAGGQTWGSKGAPALLPAYCTLAFALSSKEQLSRYRESVQKRAQILRSFNDIDKSSKALIVSYQANNGELLCFVWLPLPPLKKRRKKKKDFRFIPLFR